MDEIELLRGVLAGTGESSRGSATTSGACRRPAPTTTWARWSTTSSGGCRCSGGGQRRAFEGDPSDYQRGDDPAAEFRAAADRIVAGWSEHGFDRQVTLGGGELPAEMAFNMTVMEYMGHGWDLATATGQPMPWSEAQATDALARADDAAAAVPGRWHAVRPPVDVPDGAPAIDRLAGFLGRTP